MRAAVLLEVLGEGLDAIGRLSKLADAKRAIAAVRAIVSIMDRASELKITPERARQDLGVLVARLADSDAAADAELARRFPGQ